MTKIWEPSGGEKWWKCLQIQTSIFILQLKFQVHEMQLFKNSWKYRKIILIKIWTKLTKKCLKFLNITTLGTNDDFWRWWPTKFNQVLSRVPGKTNRNQIRVFGQRGIPVSPEPCCPLFAIQKPQRNCYCFSLKEVRECKPGRRRGVLVFCKGQKGHICTRDFISYLASEGENRS